MSNIDDFEIKDGVLVKYTGRAANVTIPNDGSVTSLGYGCFYACTSLTSITIPSSVTSLGEGCFSACTSLASITIPSSVTWLGTDCFNSCASLTSITIPSSVTWLGGECFAWCDSLESISIEEGNPVYHSTENCVIETATGRMVWGCKNSIIPDDGSVSSLEDGCFFCCPSLEHITIPDSVTSLGHECFYDCYSLTSITIPSSVTWLGDECFEGCDNLTIYAEEDSAAAAYAEENGINLELI